MLKRTILILLVLPSAALLVGCDAGNENPISPQMMEEQRQKEANQRGNFNPETSRPATGG